MSDTTYTCPQSREQALNMYFLEHRAKLLDLAAFLDRLDRAQPASETVDFRQSALYDAVGIVMDGKPHRAERILSLLSDDSTDLNQSAHGMKGASGAAKPEAEASR